MRTDGAGTGVPGGRGSAQPGPRAPLSAKNAKKAAKKEKKAAKKKAAKKVDPEP
jgi:hypothetical protein